MDSTILEKYKNLGAATEIDSFVYPKTFKFFPSAENYNDGYAYRYFVRRVNSHDVIEVSSENFDQITDKLYCKVLIQWTLVGPINDVYQSGKIYQYGVSTKNKLAVAEAAKIMPELKQHLANSYSQFATNKN
jgi:hypothetical protein